MQVFGDPKRLPEETVSFLTAAKNCRDKVRFLHSPDVTQELSRMMGFYTIDADCNQHRFHGHEW